MKAALFWAPTALFLAGCASPYPSTLESRDGLAFPLEGCLEQHLEEGAKRIAAFEPGKLSYDKSWVCVTRTSAKALHDRQAAAEPHSTSPVHDATMGPVSEPSPEIPALATSTALPPTKEEIVKTQLAVSTEEGRLRRHLEMPLIRPTEGRSFGIALAGGGSKAAAFGTGVLAGLADTGLLDSAQYVSTVSGGGYAAYFYFSHKILPTVRGNGAVPSSVDLYRDCVRLPGRWAKFPEYTDAQADDRVMAAIIAKGACEQRAMAPPKSPEKAETFKYQMLLRCQQDVLQPGQCSSARTEEDWGISTWAAVTTVLTMPVSWASSTLFDWGFVTSPAAIAYRDGIGMSYGASATDLSKVRALGQGSGDTTMVQCPPERDAFARDCTKGPWFSPKPNAMTYEEMLQGLQAARAARDPLPFWIINAVAPESRSSLGWWTNAGKFNVLNSDIFEMTAVSHGSGNYGFVASSMYIHGFTVLDSVGAAAAFLDPNQNAIGGRLLRGPIGVAQRFFNVDWGIDISNYNVRDERRSLHRAMPLPIWDSAISKWVIHRGQPEEDKRRVGSAFIRLIDGGNGENLGLYSLLKRDVKVVMVSDASYDSNGTFDDLCEVWRRLNAITNLKDNHDVKLVKKLVVPGLKGFDTHCEELRKGGELGYGVHAWPFDFPALLACVRTVEQYLARGSTCDRLVEEEVRLVVVKPALNIQKIRADLNKGSEKERGKIKDCSLPGDAYRPSVVSCDVVTFLLNNWSPKEGNCQTFPQHSTVLATANSSATLFTPYRELARQYAAAAAELIAGLRARDPRAGDRFETIAREQASVGLTSQELDPSVDPFCGRPPKPDVPPTSARQDVFSVPSPSPVS